MRSRLTALVLEQGANTEHIGPLGAQNTAVSGIRDAF
jgi:hypothetical protein